MEKPNLKCGCWDFEGETPNVGKQFYNTAEDLVAIRYSKVIKVFSERQKDRKNEYPFPCYFTKEDIFEL